MAQYGYHLGASRVITLEKLMWLVSQLLGHHEAESRLPTHFEVTDTFTGSGIYGRAHGESGGVLIPATTREIVFRMAWSDALQVRGTATSYRYNDNGGMQFAIRIQKMQVRLPCEDEETKGEMLSYWQERAASCRYVESTYEVRPTKEKPRDQNKVVLVANFIKTFDVGIVQK